MDIAQRARVRTAFLFAGLLVGTWLTGCAGPAPDERAADDQQSTAPVSSAGPAEERWADQRSLQDCMQAKGWVVEVEESDGSILAEYPEDQSAAFDADWDACHEEFPPGVVEVSRGVAEAYFDGLVKAAQCLQQRGIDVPPQPSKQASVESMLSGGGTIDPLWDPFELLDRQGLPIEEQEGARKACPRPEWGQM